MSNYRPKPAKVDSLHRIKEHVIINSVVDVGVNKKTGELIKVFPDLHHYLFEPVSSFYRDIEQNYSDIDHTLYKTALSDICTINYLVVTSLEKNGKPTHSHISQSDRAIDGMICLSSEAIQVNRFDKLEIADEIEPNFILKVDVDGKDLEVLKGFGTKIQLASVIVVECTLNTLTERVSYLEESGFTLIDLVDLVYYGNSMYQLDAILVRNNLINEKVKPAITDFRRDIWFPLELKLEN